MKLLIDFGNSRCKWALLDNEGLSPSGIIDYQQQARSNRKQYVIERLPINQANQIDCVSVLGEVFDQAFTSTMRDEFSSSAYFHYSQVDNYGIRLAYADPSSYGSDRYACLIAVAREPGAKIIVDVGTAVTIDAMDADNVHLGGLIFSGSDLMSRALSARATGIEEIGDPQKVEYLNNTTAQSVYSGGLLSQAHAIHSIVNTIKASLFTPVKIFITGGGADNVVRYVDHDYLCRPNLVLEGLQLMQRG